MEIFLQNLNLCCNNQHHKILNFLTQIVLPPSHNKGRIFIKVCILSIELSLFRAYSVRLIAVVGGLVLNLAFLFASFGYQLHQVNDSIILNSLEGTITDYIKGVTMRAIISNPAE